MDKQNTTIPDFKVHDVEHRYIPGTELSDGAFVQAVGRSPTDKAVQIRCDETGQVMVSQETQSCIAQMMTNQIVIMNALDTLLRRQFEPQILGHIENCVKCTVAVQRPLLPQK